MQTSKIAVSFNSAEGASRDRIETLCHLGMTTHLCHDGGRLYGGYVADEAQKSDGDRYKGSHNLHVD